MKKLPVGLSDFKQVIEDDYYYVDKSLLIKELIDQGATALLLPRPRRFGKTLNLSMLRHFFEKTESDTSALFRHLKIWQAGEEYTKRQGKYPVIYLTFKDVKEANWESALRKIKRLIAAEFERQESFLEEKNLTAKGQKFHAAIINLEAEQADYEDSLKQLTHDLARHHNERVVVLIDEYDTPIQAGYLNGYYEEVVGFMRNFLSAGLKDNSHLSKGVLTGIMRLAKESIFSGLNNLEVYSLLSHDFADKFGLTEAEVKLMLRDFQCEEDEESVNQWYNGYRFGSVVIYNPWSIINYLNKREDGFKPYWLNTSDNTLIEQLLTRGGVELKDELESLIKRESVEKPIEESIVFAEIEQQDDVLWSFLLFSGYLKYVGKRQQGDRWFYQLQIPNREVSSIYARLVERWFKARLPDKKLRLLLTALLQGDIENFEELFAEFVKNSFSFLDSGGREAEKVYQAFTIGLLVWLEGRYEVKSNGESGFGRYDVMLIPRDLKDAGIIIEFKKVNTQRKEKVESAVAKAFQQIEEKEYASVLQARGVCNIRKLAIVFKGKQVWVKERTAV